MKLLNISRRDFVKYTSLGVLGISLKNIAFANNSKNSQNNPNKKIITRKLGKTGIEVPIVSMGVMRADQPQLIEKAYEMGIRHFDTAHSYQNGKNEQLLGEVLSKYKRDTYIIATKISVEGIDRRTGEITKDLSLDEFMNKLNISLERLKTSYVDILYYHAISSPTVFQNESFIKCLTEAKKSGKARFIGISTHKSEPEVIQGAIDSKIIDVVLTSYNFKQSHYQQIKEKIALAAENGLGIIAMKTMAGVYLDKERTKKINCKAALKWVLQDVNVHTSIPGITNLEELYENFDVACNLELTKEEENDLEIAKQYASLYCDGCVECTLNCQKNLPVPDIMRAYMYGYGYQQFKQSKELLEELSVEKNPCEECKFCTIQCPKNFNIKEKIADITKILDIPTEFLA